MYRYNNKNNNNNIIGKSGPEEKATSGQRVKDPMARSGFFLRA